VPHLPSGETMSEKTQPGMGAVKLPMEQKARPSVRVPQPATTPAEQPVAARESGEPGDETNIAAKRSAKTTQFVRPRPPPAEPAAPSGPVSDEAATAAKRSAKTTQFARPRPPPTEPSTSSPDETKRSAKTTNLARARPATVPPAARRRASSPPKPPPQPSSGKTKIATIAAAVEESVHIARKDPRREDD